MTYIRTKKMTDPAVLETNPASQEIARNGLDAPIQEVFDLLVNKTLGASAAENIAYPDAINDTLYKVMQTILTAGSGSIPPDNAITDIKLSDTAGQIKEKVTSLLADTKFQIAGGTGTAITLTINEALIDGLPITFVASGNNLGSATTINVKPLYKPNTVLAPTLIAGKAYTVWYSLPNVCFFIKASAEGTSVVGDVLAGHTFSNDNDTGLTGTMVNKVGSATLITPNTVQQAIPQGYYDGVLTSGKVDVLPSNIKSRQSGTLVLSAVNTNITIASVDLTKAIVIIRSYLTSASYATQCAISGYLTTTTNLSIDVTTLYATYQKVEWEVIEFNNIKSLQYGSVSINTSLTNTAISSVDIDKTLVFYSFKSAYVGSSILALLVSSYLTTATNLQSIIGFNTGTLYYYIVEFN